MLRPALRPRADLTWQRIRLRGIRPSQQYYGPHKEYFQTPASAQAAFEDAAVPPGHPRPPPIVSPPALDEPRSRTRRLLRSLLWAILSFSVGAYTNYAERSHVWQHLEFDQQGVSKRKEEVLDEHFGFDSYPLLRRLKEDPDWHTLRPDLATSNDPYPFVQHVDPFMAQALRPMRGIQMKAFINPGKTMLCFVFRFGTGVESEPGIVHNGALASVIEDSFDWLGSLVFPTAHQSADVSAVLAGKQLQIDFFQPLPSGCYPHSGVYSFWIVPAGILAGNLSDRAHVNDNELPGPKFTQELSRSLVGMVEQCHRLPAIDTEGYDRGPVRQFARARVTYQLRQPEIEQAKEVLPADEEDGPNNKEGEEEVV